MTKLRAITDRVSSPAFPASAPATQGSQSDAPVVAAGPVRGRGYALSWFHRRRGFMCSVLVILGAWEILGRTRESLILPPFSESIAFLWGVILDGTLVSVLAVSLSTLAIGLSIAVVFGIAIGAAMGVSHHVRWALDVYVNGAMTAPLIAFVPIFIIIFGLGPEPRIATVVIYAIFPVIINTEAGIRDVDKSLVEMARSFGAGRVKTLWSVRIPSSRNYILAGIQLASGRAVKGLISGEYLIAVVGLGALIHQYGTAFSMVQLYGLILFLILLALIVRWVTDGLVRLTMTSRG